jgi:hypothetical protein
MFMHVRASKMTGTYSKESRHGEVFFGKYVLLTE